jgi:hypothetical protein
MLELRIVEVELAVVEKGVIEDVAAVVVDGEEPKFCSKYMCIFCIGVCKFFFFRASNVLFYKN